jgi:hypothetical protein
VHELGLCRHDGIHLHLVPKVIPFVFAQGSKDVILLNICREVILALIWIIDSQLMLPVLLTFSRLRLRDSRELLSALLQLSHEAALMHGVGRFPAKGAVELAWLVKCSSEGILALLAPLTAARSPRASLVGSRSLRASRSLGERLHVVKP